MAERDLIERLDDAVEAILAGRRDGLALAEPELATLLVVAGDLRDLPDPNFRSKLKAELMPALENDMTTMTAEATKTGFHTITPYLNAENADGVIAFLQETLGAELKARYPAPDGRRVMHAEVRVGDSMIEMGDVEGEFKPFPMALHVYIDDVDGIYTADPKDDPSAELIPRIGAKELMARGLKTLPIDRIVLQILGSAKHIKEVQIVNGLKRGNISKALAGDHVGTIVHAD